MQDWEVLLSYGRMASVHFPFSWTLLTCFFYFVYIISGLFPERVFQDDRCITSLYRRPFYVMLNVPFHTLRIDDVVSLPDSKGNPGRASARVKTLKRGLLPEADTVLDYLVGSVMFHCSDEISPVQHSCVLRMVSTMLSEEDI